MPLDLKTDGAAAARRSAGVLGIALCAETSHTTLNVDSGKVDLTLQFRHPFHQNHPVITAHCQVKAGPSYCRKTKDSKVLTLTGVDRETIESLCGGTQPALLVWVPPKPNENLYWHIVRPKRQQTPIRIPRSQSVSPALRFDLVKGLGASLDPIRFVRQDVAALSEEQVMRKARQAYNGLKRQCSIHPIVGPLQVSRLAWRHVTRQGRSGLRRLVSLKAVPYLSAFLNRNPDRYLVDPKETLQTGGRIVERREVVCWYENALMMDGTIYGLRFRIFEKISYPSYWLRLGLGIEDVQHTATLQSWWCKPRG